MNFQSGGLFKIVDHKLVALGWQGSASDSAKLRDRTGASAKVANDGLFWMTNWWC